MTHDDAPPVRRPVRDEDVQSREGRAGCIAFGAVLGIAAGSIFTFFALPPLIDHFVGETRVAVRAAYEDETRIIRVVSVVQAPDLEPTPAGGPSDRIVIRLAVTARESWKPSPDDFRLELADGGDRLSPLPSLASAAETGLSFAPGEERTLILRYALPASGSAVPRALHLQHPAVRFELPTLR